MWTAVFWKDALERAVRTAAQAFVAMTVAAGTGLLNSDWVAGLSTAGMAAVLSVLTSLAGEWAVPTGTASLTTAVVPRPEPPPPGPFYEGGDYS